MKNFRTKTLILGVCNILLRDEGVGVRVIEYLQSQTLPEGVEIVDGGTAGADLIDVFADRETVIIVDAIQSDRPAGTILRLTPDDLKLQEDCALSMHDLDIPQTLAMTKMLNCNPKNVICFGVVPKCIAPGMELSDEIAEIIPTLAEKVLKEALVVSG